MLAPLYDLTTNATGRHLMAALWQSSLFGHVLSDPSLGVLIRDDFTKYRNPTGTTSPAVAEGWSVADSAAAGGTYSFATVAGPYGIAELNSTGTTNHFGAEAQYLPAMVCTSKHATTPKNRVVFQTRFDAGDADTIFIGLSESGDNFLSATSTLPADSDYIGFYSTDNGATWTFVSHNDNAAGTAVTDSFTIPAGTYGSDYNNFGFAVNKDGSVEVVVNDNYLATLSAGIRSTAVPIETLTIRKSATAGGGSTAPTVSFDDTWCAVFG